MGRCNNRRVQQAAQASRNTPSRARFSKAPPTKRKNKPKSAAGRGGGGRSSSSETAASTSRTTSNYSTSSRNKRNGASSSSSSSAAVIDKLSKRVVQASSSHSSGGTRGNDSLKGVDISRLDEIALSEASIQLVSKLLRDLNVINVETEQQEQDQQLSCMDDTAGLSSASALYRLNHTRATKEEYSDRDQHHDDDNVIFDEQQQRFASAGAACLVAGYVEYEHDFEEQDDKDDDVELVLRQGPNIDDSSIASNDQQEQCCSSGDETNEESLSHHDEQQHQDHYNDSNQSNNNNDDDDNRIIRESPIFAHLTTRLSFSQATVEKACRAIQNWQQVAAVAVVQQEPAASTIHKNDGAAPALMDSDQLALAMDWLCLHLTDEELKAGFRPNPRNKNNNMAATRSSLSSGTTGPRTKPIPHSSISVAKPITSDREWRDTLKVQSRTVGFARLGFHQEEAQRACQQTALVSETISSLDDEDGLRVLLSMLEKDALGESLVLEEPNNPTDFDFAESEREQETQALEAIFDDQFQHASHPQDMPGYGRYLLTVTPVEDLGHANDECKLHVFLRPGYPVLSPPLLLFTNPMLPPTLLRRINVGLIQHAHESIGEPIVFSAVDFLANSVHEMQNDFVKEQRAKEMQAEQLRMRREVGHDVDDDADLWEQQFDTDGKLGRRQKAKQRAAEKAFQSSDQQQQKEDERRRREKERLERIKGEELSLRQTLAQRAIAQREQERMEEEAERAARLAMNAAFNRGESADEARAAASRARKESLHQNGATVASSDEEVDEEHLQLDKDVSNVGTVSQEATFANEGATAEKPQLLAATQPTLSSNATPATMAFMERLRKCYNDAVKEKIEHEKAEASVVQRNGGTHMGSEVLAETGGYHFSDPPRHFDNEETNAPTSTSRNEHIPTPVPLPTGDLTGIMKDVIQSQEEQPWLVSSDARVPTVRAEEAEITEQQRRERNEINKKLKEELVKKYRAADAWARSNSEYSSSNGSKGGGKPQQFHMMRLQRERLPAYLTKEEIVDTIKSNQVTVISADTGAGKTTQVPQLVFDDMIMAGLGAEANMIVTQPRRISAIGVSERIAAERCERLGETVGYSIRLENRRSAKTRLLLCTTGILLRRLQCDPDLASISHVFVDEVHERDLNTDFLLIILRDLLARRKSLKLVLMSATLNATAFSDYFGGCPVVSIPGRAFPVTENRLEDILQLTGYQVQENSDFALKLNSSRPTRFSKSALRRMYYPKYSSDVISSLAIVDESAINYELMAELVEHICLNNDEGAILIFLPGMMEITKAIEELYKKELFQSSKTVVYPLHSSLSTAEQTAIFEVPPEGVRKIVVATNIAETSITIEDVVYVVDTGRVKENQKDEINEMPTLVETWVSRASAKQRRGRAGRVRKGIAYHMYSSHTYEHELEDYQLPEMRRVGLEDLVLQILLLDLGEPSSFLAKAVNPPSAMAMRNSLKLLEGLGAVEVEWTAGESVTFSDAKLTQKGSEATDAASCRTVSADSGLTALGFHLATLPVDPRVGKMMIYGALFQVTDPALTIAASMSARSPFVSPFDKRDEADAARKEFAMEGSDHLTTLNAFNAWKDMRRTKGEKATRSFLQENFLSRMTLFQMEDLKRQFSDLLKDVGFLPLEFRIGGKGGGKRGFNSRGPEAPRSAADAYSDNMALVKAILCAGMYPNIIVAPRSLVRTGGGKSDKQAGECAFQSLKGEVYLHPSTISFSEKQLDSRYCCYHEIVRTSKTYVRDCTTVSEFALLLFGGSLKIYHTHGVVTVDDWLKFRISPKAAALVKHLRAQMESMLLKKILSPTEDITGSDESKALIQAVSVLFESEIKRGVESTGADIVRPWTGTQESERWDGNRRRTNGNRGRSSRGGDGRGSRQGNGGAGRRGGRGRGNNRSR